MDVVPVPSPIDVSGTGSLSVPVLNADPNIAVITAIGDPPGDLIHLAVEHPMHPAVGVARTPTVPIGAPKEQTGTVAVVAENHEFLAVTVILPAPLIRGGIRGVHGQKCRRTNQCRKELLHLPLRCQN